MSDWKQAALGDLVEVHNNRRVPLSKIVRAERRGPYPYFGAQGVVDHIDDFIFDGEFLLLAEDGENLRSRKEPIARLASGRFWVNNHAHILRSRPGVADNRFLMHFINQAPLNGRVTGAAQPKLTKANLVELAVPCPRFAAQRRIAAVLSAFDELIEINERRIELLEDLARSLYREWFVRFRFAGHEEVELVDSELGPVPEGWEVRPLGDLVTLHSRSVRPADQPGAIFEHFSIPAFDAGALPAMEPGSAIKSAKYRVEAESVLLSKINPRIPRVWLAQPRSAEGIASTEFLIWVGVEVSNAWLWSLFWDRTFRGKLLGSAGGTSTSHQRFKPTDVAGQSVPLPSVAVLEAFDSLAEPALEQAASLREHNHQLAATRDLLLPRLVTGRLDISDVDLGVLTPTETE